MAEPYVRFVNTLPVKDATGTVVTPGKLELWDVDADGTERKWPARIVENIVDARVLLKPDGTARIRLLIEVGQAAGEMRGPDPD